MSSNWCDNFADKYPAEIYEGRARCEAFVCGILWQDPLLIDECGLYSEDFQSAQGRLFFDIMKILRNHKICNFEESAIKTYIDKNTLERFYNIDGFNTMRKIVNSISHSNKDAYLDLLAKYNIYTKLFDNGFDFSKQITLPNKKVVKPLEYFSQKQMTASEVISFYTARLSELDRIGNDNIVQEESLQITDADIEHFNNGEEMGSEYSNSGTDENDDIMNTFPWLNSQTLGLKSGATHFIGGFSSSGKTSLWCNLLYSMASSRRLHQDGDKLVNIEPEKVLIICNEQKSNVWKINMLTLVLYKYFRKSNITKSMFEKGFYTQEQMKYIKKAQKYFNENYAKNIYFIQMSTNNIDVIKNKIQYYALQHGCTMVIYDTLKAPDSIRRGANTQAYEELTKLSRDLDRLAKKYNLIMCASIQLAQSYKGNLFLDSSMLSGSKQTIEVLDTLLNIRDVYKEELDPNSPVYISPFRKKVLTEKDINDHRGLYADKSPGDIVYVEYPEFNRDAKWKAIFLSKSRNSVSSDASGECLLFEFYGELALFREECWGRPKHTRIDANSKI